MSDNETIQASTSFVEFISALIANNAVKMVFHEKIEVDF